MSTVNNAENERISYLCNCLPNMLNVFVSIFIQMEETYLVDIKVIAI